MAAYGSDRKASCIVSAIEAVAEVPAPQSPRTNSVWRSRTGVDVVEGVVVDEAIELIVVVLGAVVGVRSEVAVVVDVQAPKIKAVDRAQRAGVRCTEIMLAPGRRCTSY
jgi:hypothetical protein